MLLWIVRFVAATLLVFAGSPESDAAHEMGLGLEDLFARVLARVTTTTASALSASQKRQLHWTCKAETQGMYPDSVCDQLIMYYEQTFLPEIPLGSESALAAWVASRLPVSVNASDAIEVAHGMVRGARRECDQFCSLPSVLRQVCFKWGQPEPSCDRMEAAAKYFKTSVFSNEKASHRLTHALVDIVLLSPISRETGLLVGLERALHSSTDPSLVAPTCEVVRQYQELPSTACESLRSHYAARRPSNLTQMPGVVGPNVIGDQHISKKRNTDTVEQTRERHSEHVNVASKLGEDNKAWLASLNNNLKAWESTVREDPVISRLNRDTTVSRQRTSVQSLDGLATVDGHKGRNQHIPPTTHNNVLGRPIYQSGLNNSDGWLNENQMMASDQSKSLTSNKNTKSPINTGNYGKSGNSSQVPNDSKQYINSQEPIHALRDPYHEAARKGKGQEEYFLPLNFSESSQTISRHAAPQRDLTTRERLTNLNETLLNKPSLPSLNITNQDLAQGGNSGETLSTNNTKSELSLDASQSISDAQPPNVQSLDDFGDIFPYLIPIPTVEKKHFEANDDANRVYNAFNTESVRTVTTAIVHPSNSVHSSSRHRAHLSKLALSRLPVVPKLNIFLPPSQRAESKPNPAHLDELQTLSILPVAPAVFPKSRSRTRSGLPESFDSFDSHLSPPQFPQPSVHDLNRANPDLSSVAVPTLPAARASSGLSVVGSGEVYHTAIKHRSKRRSVAHILAPVPPVVLHPSLVRDALISPNVLKPQSKTTAILHVISPEDQPNEDGNSNSLSSSLGLDSRGAHKGTTGLQTHSIGSSIGPFHKTHPQFPPQTLPLSFHVVPGIESSSQPLIPTTTPQIEWQESSPIFLSDKPLLPPSRSQGRRAFPKADSFALEISTLPFRAPNISRGFGNTAGLLDHVLRNTNDPCGAPDFDQFQRRRWGSPNICSTSFVGSERKCSGAIGYSHAAALCRALGPAVRLCSAAELRQNEAVDSGCHYEQVRVWSSDVLGCPAGFSLTLAGGSRDLLEECQPFNETNFARCCAFGIT